MFPFLFVFYSFIGYLSQKYRIIDFIRYKQTKQYRRRVLSS